MKASIDPTEDDDPAGATGGPRLRWGIAGYGDVVARRVAPAIAARGTASLAAIWGRDAARARGLAEQFRAPLATTKIETLCEAVDALYVATPVSAHVELATIAAGRGLPVLIEKPLSAGLGDLDGFLDALRFTRASVGIAYYRRLMPVARWLAAEIAAGTFGAFRRAEIAFASPFDPSNDDPKAWRLDRSVSGGGVLADAGSHRVDLLCALLGRPVVVEAHLGNFSRGGCERIAVLVLSWANGAEALLDLRWDGAAQDRFALTFAHAELLVDPLDAGRIVCRRGDEVTTIDCGTPANPHAALVTDFEAALSGNRPPVCGVSDGLFVDALIVAARWASDTDRAVALPDRENDAAAIVRFIASAPVERRRVSPCVL